MKPDKKNWTDFKKNFKNRQTQEIQKFQEGSALGSALAIYCGKICGKGRSLGWHKKSDAKLKPQK